MARICVAGGGGFIGSHLVKALKAAGHWVRAVDIHVPEFGSSLADEFQHADLRDPASAILAASGCDEIYQLAADMGGIGYISKNHAAIAVNNVLININMIKAAIAAGAKILYSSSACVYNQAVQNDAQARPLREEDAHPAAPERGYGWEKLYSEQLYLYHRDDYGLPVRIVRFHNVYGPEGTYQGGREKAPAAACRKVALAQDGEVVDVWGDGQQTRTFMYIDDCVEGLQRLMAHGFSDPLNLGTDELVTIDDLFMTVAGIARKSIRLHHDLSGPQGVRGRNSDNRLLLSTLGWQPTIKLADGLAPTYAWINDHLQRK